MKTIFCLQCSIGNQSLGHNIGIQLWDSSLGSNLWLQLTWLYFTPNIYIYSSNNSSIEKHNLCDELTNLRTNGQSKERTSLAQTYTTFLWYIRLQKIFLKRSHEHPNITTKPGHTFVLERICLLIMTTRILNDIHYKVVIKPEHCFLSFLSHYSQSFHATNFILNPKFDIMYIENNKYMQKRTVHKDEQRYFHV